MGPLWIAAGVLAVSGVAKLNDPAGTAPVLQLFRIPMPHLAARVLGAAELLLAIAAVLIGHPLLWGGVAAAYTIFCIVVLVLLRRPDAASCGCFGREDTPPTIGHLLFNAIAATLAGLAATDPVQPTALGWSTAEWFAAITLVVAGSALCVLAMTRLPRLRAIVAGTAPAVAQFTIDPHRRAT